MEWRKFTRAMARGTDTMPVTPMLVALHNMITESVAPAWITPVRRHYYCPAALVTGLKAGLFATDEAMQKFDLPKFTVMPGVPGLSEDHVAVSCSQAIAA